MLETYIYTQSINPFFSGYHILDILNVLKYIWELKNDLQDSFKPFCLTFSFLLF